MKDPHNPFWAQFWFMRHFLLKISLYTVCFIPLHLKTTSITDLVLQAVGVVCGLIWDVGYLISTQLTLTLLDSGNRFNPIISRRVSASSGGLGGSHSLSQWLVAGGGWGGYNSRLHTKGKMYGRGWLVHSETQTIHPPVTIVTGSITHIHSPQWRYT